jgi:hypothetical protein
VQNAAPKVDYVALAREQYLAFPEKVTIPERHDVWHLLVSLKGRTLEQAKQRAADIRARLLAGESRESLAETLSDDGTAAGNKGNLGVQDLTKFDPRFAQAARKLKVGEVSQPFESGFGVHIVRLNAHEPAKRFKFEDAKEELAAEAENQHLRSVWSEHLRKIQNDPKLFVDTEALDTIRPKQRDLPKQFPQPTQSPAPSLPGSR